MEHLTREHDPQDASPPEKQAAETAVKPIRDVYLSQLAAVLEETKQRNSHRTVHIDSLDGFFEAEDEAGADQFYRTIYRLFQPETYGQHARLKSDNPEIRRIMREKFAQYAAELELKQDPVAQTQKETHERVAPATPADQDGNIGASDAPCLETQHTVSENADLPRITSRVVTSPVMDHSHGFEEFEVNPNGTRVRVPVISGTKHVIYGDERPAIIPVAASRRGFLRNVRQQVGTGLAVLGGIFGRKR